MTDTSRDKLLAKIAALRSKTLDNGCTEQEAMAAAAKAAELMDAHDIEEAELARAEDRAPSFDIGLGNVGVGEGRVRPPILFVAVAIEKLCGVKMATRRTRTGYSINMVGDRGDREMARFLLEVIGRAFEDEYEAYARRNRGALGRSSKPSFQMGMIHRLNERLWQLVRERREAARTGGTALVVVDAKAALVAQAVPALLGKLSASRKNGKTVRHGSAYRAGQAAGDRVGLGRPLAGGAATACIA